METKESLINKINETDYALLNKGGNEGFRKKLVKLVEVMEAKKTLGGKYDAMISFLTNLKKLEKQKMYGDLYDTDVRDIVIETLDEINTHHGIIIKLDYFEYYISPKKEKNLIT